MNKILNHVSEAGKGESEMKVVTSFGRNGRKFVEANPQWSKLISKWLVQLSSLQGPEQSGVQATKVELST